MRPATPPAGAGPAEPDALDALLARARAARPPPAPPPFSDVLARLDAEANAPGPLRLLRRLAPPRPARRWAAVAATVLALAGAGVLAGRLPRAGSRDLEAPIALEGGAGVRVLRGDRTIAGAEASASSGFRLETYGGDEVVADGRGCVRLDGRSTVDLEPRARLRLGTRDAVRLLSGRATFDVRHDEARPFTVGTADLLVVDRGTRFGVEVSAEPAGERVLVTVEEGRVTVEPKRSPSTRAPASAGGPPEGLELRAGEGLAFVAGKATGAPFPLDARPTLALEAEDVAPARDRPVVIRLVFQNPTDGWLVLPTYDPVRAPLHVEVRAPDGGVQAVRIAESMWVDGSGSGRSLPPRGRLALRVRFEHTFASPGTYRLRAIYRPAGTVDEGASPDLVLPVR